MENLTPQEQAKKDFESEKAPQNGMADAYYIEYSKLYCIRVHQRPALEEKAAA